MDKLKFSIVIPYKERLENIKLAFAALAEQTIGMSEFEVIVGAMEYSPDFVVACQSVTDHLNVVAVMVAGDWNLSRARNLALHHASGQVTVLLDADILLPKGFLRNLYDRYFHAGENVCVMGEMLGYDAVVRTDVDTVDAYPYSHYRSVLAELEERRSVDRDMRWSQENARSFARYPWGYARGGLMVIPTATIKRNELLFDEQFQGWGTEDQEWALRVAMTNTPIVPGEGVYGLHLPHQRNAAANFDEADANNRYFLAKWPRRDLELALAFGWREMEQIYPEFELEVSELVSEHQALGVVRGKRGDASTVVIGDIIDTRSTTSVSGFMPALGQFVPHEVLPLTGFALPYPDQSFDECYILPPVARLQRRYRDVIGNEAKRISSRVQWIDSYGR